MRKTLFSFFILALFFTCAKAEVKYNSVVAKDGSGNYKTVQAAIDAAPEGLKKPFKIFIKTGKYIEQIVIPKSKPFLEIIGENPQSTVISFGDGQGGTSAFTINADDCMLMNLTLENSQGRISDGPQSLAVRTNANHTVFFNCRFISGQDTVLVSTAGTAIYFNNCYIDGNTDFVYGAATAVFDRCVIYPRDRVDGNKGGYFTAASTPVGQTYGLVFRDCVIPDNHGITAYTLGRPWQNDEDTELKGRKRAANKVVFINTKMGNSIVPAGWSMWNKGTVTDIITYAEYKTRRFDGALTDVSQRVSWSKQLSDEEAAPYLNNTNLFEKWNPLVVWVDLSPDTRVLKPTVTNFLARNINNEAVLQFNSSWPTAGMVYELYKSQDKASPFKKLGSITTKNDTTVAYQFKDDLPADGQTDYYQIKASLGKITTWSDTLQVNTGSLLKGKRK